MKSITALCIALLLFGAGCAHLGSDSTPSDKEKALALCKEEADDQYRARYTDEWNAYVDECMKEKGYSD